MQKQQGQSDDNDRHAPRSSTHAQADTYRWAACSCLQGINAGPGGLQLIGQSSLRARKGCTQRATYVKIASLDFAGSQSTHAHVPARCELLPPKHQCGSGRPAAHRRERPADNMAGAGTGMPAHISSFPMCCGREDHQLHTQESLTRPNHTPARCLQLPPVHQCGPGRLGAPRRERPAHTKKREMPKNIRAHTCLVVFEKPNLAMSPVLPRASCSMGMAHTTEETPTEHFHIHSFVPTHNLTQRRTCLACAAASRSSTRPRVACSSTETASYATASTQTTGFGTQSHAAQTFVRRYTHTPQHTHAPAHASPCTRSPCTHKPLHKQPPSPWVRYARSYRILLG
jgi:hypothetical protein